MTQKEFSASDKHADLRKQIQVELIEMGKLGLLDGKNIPSIFARAEFEDYTEYENMKVSEIADLFVSLN